MDPTKLIENVVNRILSNVIFRAEITEVVGGGARVRIKRTGQSLADGRAYNVLKTYTSPAVGHDVLCIGGMGTVIIIGELN